MAFSIKNPEADRLARELVEATGDTLTGVVVVALRDRLEKVRARRNDKTLLDDLNEIAVRSAQLSKGDRRTPEEIIGYDERGLPT